MKTEARGRILFTYRKRCVHILYRWVCARICIHVFCIFFPRSIFPSFLTHIVAGTCLYDRCCSGNVHPPERDVFDFGRELTRVHRGSDHDLFHCVKVQSWLGESIVSAHTAVQKAIYPVPPFVKNALHITFYRFYEYIFIQSSFMIFDEILLSWGLCTNYYFKSILILRTFALTIW